MKLKAMYNKYNCRNTKDTKITEDTFFSPKNNTMTNECEVCLLQSHIDS